jgi:pSer/pThr/pTyr-binding forkhead associated (FHA) protein
MIRDLGSTNGIYLNRSHIDGPTELRSGDHIELGETEIVFEAP